MNKLLFDSPRGVKLQKNLAQKVVEIVNLPGDRYRQFSQNLHFIFSPVDFRYYRTSGKKSVWEYLDLLKNCMGTKGGVSLKKTTFVFLLYKVFIINSTS